ncbi:MAG TPA: dihydroneopterin aldolase [Firmicutes bacterium]|nr:dihydroneopterin aldolase [Bacillota bacterium]
MPNEKSPPSKTASNASDHSARDRVRLVGMQFYGYHGATPQERQIGQRFEVDVEMAVDTEKIVDGDLGTTIDYRIVYEICRRCCAELQYRLIETMAREIAREILRAHDLPGVRVTVRKPCVPLGGVISVGAEATVERGEI